MTIRVHADDLAGIIHAASDARADLETCIRNATEAAEQWRDELTELLEQFNGFRRAVQEATGLDQAELLHDDELVARIRRPYAVFNIDRATVSDATPSLPEDALERVDGLPEVSVEIKGMFTGAMFGGPGVTVGEPFAGFPESGEQDGPPAPADIDHAHDAQRPHRQHGYVLGCAVHGAHPHGEHYCDVCTMCRPAEADEQVEQDGPATESMPAVEEPPALPDGCSIGRVFTRDTDWDLSDLMPLAVVNRLGDWWEFSHIPDGAPNGDQAVYNCAALDKTRTFAELLHMHGTLWEVLDSGERPVEGEARGE